MKIWDIAFKKDTSTEVQKLLKRILKPVISVGRPQKCLFCGENTTWAINNNPVCPRDSALYGFMNAEYLPDPCEVCGKQGEWCTEGGTHSLCYVHRDAWFAWSNPELGFIDSKVEPEKWEQVWEEGWKKFIDFMKERATK